MITKEETSAQANIIGDEGEKQAEEYLSKNGYVIFDYKEINEKYLKYGKKIDYPAYPKPEECPKNTYLSVIRKIAEEIDKIVKKNEPCSLLKRDDGNYEYYKVDYVKAFEELGCILSEKEKDYLKNNGILGIGDLTGKRISDNKLTCFEIKTRKNGYFTSGRTQFEENCIARKSEIAVFYVLINYGKEKVEIVDIAELWFKQNGLKDYDLHQPVRLIKKSEAIEKKKLYYSNIAVRFEIIKCLKHREMSMLNPRIDIDKKMVRYLIAFNLEYLNKHLERFAFNKCLANLYHSVAILKEIPIFSYNLKERTKIQEYQDFNKNYDRYVVGYNLFIDIDNENWQESLKDTLEVKKIFDEYKVPYYILNSSYKGFHLHIPAEYMPKKDIFELIAEINNVAYNLRGIYDIKSIDTSIFDLKRICKVPYSLNHDGAVCLPLNDLQLSIYSPEIVKMENVLKTIIRDRGKLIRTHNLSEEQLKENVSKFINDFQ